MANESSTTIPEVRSTVEPIRKQLPMCTRTVAAKLGAVIAVRWPQGNCPEDAAGDD